MTILFEDFAEGRHPGLKFSPGLVLGWLTKDNAAFTETRFALSVDGSVLRSEPVPVVGPGSNDFAPKGRKWTKVESVPADAEFIGNYPKVKS